MATGQDPYGLESVYVSLPAMSHLKSIHLLSSLYIECKAATANVSRVVVILCLLCFSSLFDLLVDNLFRPVCIALSTLLAPESSEFDSQGYLKMAERY
jgi:hypothetical protein